MMKRKLETRNKIELGGLVIKSGLDQLSKAAILGILVEARNKLEEKQQTLEYYQALGNIEFNKD